MRIPSWQGGQRSEEGDGWPGDQRQPSELDFALSWSTFYTKAIHSLATYSLPTEERSTSFTFNSQELGAAGCCAGLSQSARLIAVPPRRAVSDTDIISGPGRQNNNELASFSILEAIDSP